MATSDGYIWIVEHQPEVAGLLQQAVQALGYQTRLLSSGGEALAAMMEAPPTLVIADLHLPGLSGKDLLVALQAQSLDAPVVIVAGSGEQKDIIQAFRLGAADYLQWPMREPEVVAAVERVMERSRARQERDALMAQVRKVNATLQQRLQDLQTISALGKAVVSTTSQQELFTKILEGAAHISHSDVGWFLLRIPRKDAWLLAAQKSLPGRYAHNLHRFWDDGVSPKVAASGKPVLLTGRELARYPKLQSVGKALAFVPVRTSKDVAGVLVVARKEARPYTSHDQAMVMAVADYAAIALTNARMMRVLEERARRLEHMTSRLQIDEHIKASLLSNASMVLREPLNSALGYADMMAEEHLGNLNLEQLQAVEVIRQKLRITTQVAEYLTSLSEQEKLANEKTAFLQSAVQHVLPHLQFVAEQHNVTFDVTLETNESGVPFSPVHLERVIEAILVNALGFSRPGAKITLETGLDGQQRPFLRVHSHPQALTPAQRRRLLNLETQGLLRSAHQFHGVSVGLSLARKIAALYGADLRVRAPSEEEMTFTLLLPASPSPKN